MNKPLQITLAALATTLALAGAAAESFARDRSVSGTGAGGRSYSRSLDSGCLNGTCGRSREGTTRGGNSWYSNRGVSNNGDGTYSASRSAAGPRGATVNGTGTTDGNGTWSYSGTATGPNGGAVEVDKSVTVTPAN
ncbi:hypothetical protein L2U69_06790 [Zavarzinia compransoris]|uniref:hypothetical protein n=1 Tax=Zavarzinia marina TaxID=2911065 RepID=UPI001F18F6F3|nr:hypothetical protein [Zavarzinia marina]MCF4165345.1 hypothetical protein [Zavarzinia marina]